MSQRVEARDSADDFPTPPWATRALIEHVLAQKQNLKQLTCWEPACGAGHMSKVLAEYYGSVRSTDAYDYCYGAIFNFVTGKVQENSVDWVITNPPFKHGQEFILRSLRVARKGVAILARSVFIESIGRYYAIFEQTPPTVFAQFTERVPMVRGRLDRKASTATGYAWLVWEKRDRQYCSTSSRLFWIPPCRKKLEREGDYENPLPSKSATDTASQSALLL